MRNAILLITILLASCAPQKFSTGTPTDVLRPYVEEFVSLYGQEVVGLTYYIGPLEDRYAQCQKEIGAITVDENRWDQLCEAQKRAVTFHELGHCVLNRPHTDEPFSYMFATLRSCQFYEDNYIELDEELFSST